MIKLRIEEIATRQGLNLSRLQIRAKVTLPLLSRYWHNNTESVRLSEIEKIAHALGVKTGDLFLEVNEE